MGAALVAQCAPTPTSREIDQTSSDPIGVANPTTGQPVAAADELLVVAGGYFFQKIANYSEMTQPVAPIYAHSDATTGEYRVRGTGTGGGADTAIASFSTVEDTSHYFFVVQFMRDPISGSLILNAQGFFQNATAIAADYFDQQMLPTLSTFTKSWYVFEWTDANADHIAQPTEIVPTGSGS